MSSFSVARSAPTRASTDQLFLVVLGATAVLKLFLAAIIPLTGDEAYFLIWGRFPDYGYYDHGAMTGWWTALTLLAGKSVFLVRLPAVITALLGAFILRGVFQSIDPAKANLAATLFLLSPIYLLNVLVTADTPLLLFSLLAGAFAIRAVRRDSVIGWMVTGLFLGLAILAKYFAVLLGLAFVVYLLLAGGARRFTCISALLIGATPSLAINLAWNVNHGWTNLVFNAITRNADARLSLVSPLVLFVFVTLVLGGPVVVYFLTRPGVEGRLTWRETLESLRASGTLLALFAIVIPGVALLSISFVRRVGLHWLFSFYPFFFVVLAAKFNGAALQRQIRPAIIYVVACSSLVLALLALPVEVLQRQRSYNSIVLGTYPEAVLAQLAPYAAHFTLVSPSYTQSAQLTFHSGRYVSVIGPGSVHGRQDDFITDFRSFDGRDLMVLSARAKDAAATHPFFETVEAREIEVHGARLALVLGRGFKFATYREAVLRRVAEDYYRIPNWLGTWSRPAPFIKRYGFETAATR